MALKSSTAIPVKPKTLHPSKVWQLCKKERMEIKWTLIIIQSTRKYSDPQPANQWHSCYAGQQVQRSVLETASTSVPLKFQPCTRIIEFNSHPAFNWIHPQEHLLVKKTVNFNHGIGIYLSSGSDSRLIQCGSNLPPTKYKPSPTPFIHHQHTWLINVIQKL